MNNNNIGNEQNGLSSSSVSANTNYFLIGRGSDKSILLNETSNSSYAFTYIPNSSSVHCIFKNKRILFNGCISSEINGFFKNSIENEHTLYTVHDLKKFINSNYGSTDEMTQFMGYALRLLVEAPLELVMERPKSDEQQKQGNSDSTDGATNGKKEDKKSSEDDDDETIGFDSAEDDSDEDSVVLTTVFDSMGSQKKRKAKKAPAKTAFEHTAFFIFVKAITNNLAEWGTDRHKYAAYMSVESAEPVDLKRAKFCAKLRLKIDTAWRWEDHFFEELANNNTGEVLRIVRVPVAATAEDDAKFVLNDVFVLRCARDEVDTLPSDLNALFAENQFDCHVITVEKPPAKIAKFL